MARSSCEQFPRVGAFVHQAAQRGLDERLVFAVGDAEPAVFALEHLDFGAPFADQRIDGERQVKFALELGPVLFEEAGKKPLKFTEQPRRESPGIHRNEFLPGEFALGPVFSGADDLAVAAEYLGVFNDFRQIPGGVG